MMKKAKTTRTFTPTSEISRKLNMDINNSDIEMQYAMYV